MKQKQNKKTCLNILFFLCTAVHFCLEAVWQISANIKRMTIFLKGIQYITLFQIY